jgi:flagellar biosynthesis protein FliQ
MVTVSNWGNAMLTSLANAVNLILTFIPRIIGFLLILLIGWGIAALVSKGVIWLLRRVGFDNMANRIGLTRFDQRIGIHLDPAGVLGKIVYWFVFLIFLVAAADALGLPAVSNILNQLVAYIPNVFVAILVLFLGTLAATFIADIVRGLTAGTNIGNANIFANIARFAIIGFAALIALEQLQIAPALINELFGAVVAAAAIAFGLAFGLGGQDSARRWLNRGENSLTSAASQMQAQPQQPYAPVQGQPQQPYAPVQGQSTDQVVPAQQMNNSYQQYDGTPTQTPINRPNKR